MFDETILQRKLVIYGSSSRTAKMIHSGMWNEAIVIVLGTGRVGGCSYQCWNSPGILSHEISSTSRAPACSSLQGTQYCLFVFDDPATKPSPSPSPSPSRPSLPHSRHCPQLCHVEVNCLKDHGNRPVALRPRQLDENAEERRFREEPRMLLAGIRARNKI